MNAVHERLSVHSVCFPGATLEILDGHWRALGLRRLSLIDAQLLDGGDAVRHLMPQRGYQVETITHVFAPGPLPTDPAGIEAARDRLLGAIDIAARLGAQSIYMLTGGRGGLTWEQAAEAFSTAVAPCVRAAEAAGVALAIENASSLYVDIHLAHTLRDTITLAELAGVGICIDLFHCWTEADLDALVDRALPRTRLVQLSDYVLGDRALPARAVPGDGAIPIESFVAHLLAGGYRYGFDLELLGPRIDDEGHFEAARRACTVASAMLHRLGA